MMGEQDMGRGQSKAGREIAPISQKNLPELSGSDRQKAWASDIRDTFVERYNSLIAHGYGEKKTKEFEDSYENPGNEIGDIFITRILTNPVDGGRKLNPDERYEKWKKTDEYKNVRENIESKDQRNAILRGKQREFEKKFLSEAKDRLENETSASWYIEHRPQ